MRILWFDLNSSYSHSSLALPCIHAQIEDDNDGWDVLRSTINVNTSTIVRDIVKMNPDIILATAWLFTHEKLHAVVSRVKQLLPDVIVGFGGPEFIGPNEDYLRKNRFVDMVFRGEGEHGIHHWLGKVADRSLWGEVEGACFIADNDDYIDGGYARIKDFHALKSPEESRFFCRDRAFVQFETARGCFNTCMFCVSGGDKPVRSLPLDKVRSRLDEYMRMGIKSIRLLDRTFNGMSRRASDMLDLFREYEGKLDFHLEVHPAMLSTEVRERLKTMPHGMLHLEAGIQSLNQDVLTLSTRLGSLEDSLEGLIFLCSLDNVITHTDLIAGLPGYSYQMLYDDVYKLSSIRASEIQLETLKVLPGTKMRYDAESLGIRYSPLTPYEVMRSDAMDIDDIHKAVKLSRVIDFYYNTSVWQSLMQEIMDTNQDFLSKLIDHLSDEILEMPLSMEKRGLLLMDFCTRLFPEYMEKVSVYWVLGGLSTSKEPAKGLKALIIDKEYDPGSSVSGSTLTHNELYVRSVSDTIDGYTTPEMRYYTLNNYVFGFDRSIQRQKPVYFGELRFS